jgi:pimeloyl-ACP methyl ester carboxylesterase
MTTNTLPFDRRFARTAAGLVHLRTLAVASGAADSPPLWMMHACPASSASLQPLMRALEPLARPLCAADLAGYGDSDPLPLAEPEVTDFAGQMLASWDALGIASADVYGFHTGAHVAIEMALLAPKRVTRLVLDGLLVLHDTERGEYLERYAPPMTPDEHGTQVFRALNFIRDQAWFFPHFRRDAAHNLRGPAMPAPVLHALTVDLLKATESYHLGYRAVFRHKVLERAARLGQPVLLLADSNDPTRRGLSAVAARLPTAAHEVLTTPAGADPMALKAERIVKFLRAPAG